jgi:tetratricopeptide (TPR) repeat protein
MAGPTPCPIAEDLERFLLGQLPEEEAAGLEKHLSGCPACVRRLESLHPQDGLIDILSDVARGGASPADEVAGALLTSLYRLRKDTAGRGRDNGLGDDPSVAPTEQRDPAADEAEAGPGVDETPCGPLTPREPGEVGRVGPYRVLRILGSGGMGVVYQAQQVWPGRVVALKMILAGARAGRERLARFRRETEIAAELQHPNIVPIYEAGGHEGQPYFTMEYLPGGSLAQKLTVPLPAAQAAALVETLSRAVHFAHERGFVHRDLKPSNVLLAGDGTPKITDFGLAKQLAEVADGPGESRTQTGAVLGTPGYMAPEQAAGGADVGPAADVWALGALLYECLTGRPPFRAATMLETLEQTRTREPVPPGRLQPGLARDLETVCLKCLQKEPKRRYGTARDLADDLGRFLRGEPIRARPISRRERLAKWVRRRPALTALLAVSGLSLVLFVVGTLLYNARLRQAVRLADRQQRRADHNYRQARAVVQQMLSRLEDRALAGTPRLKELQRQQLEDALAFYQEVIQNLDDPDPAVRLDVALAHEQAGNAQLLLGRLPLAEENFRRAGDLLHTLANDHPGQPEYLVPWASCLHKLGAICMDQSRNAEAEGYYRQALHFREQLAAAQPDAPARQDALAMSHHQLGVLLQVTARQAEAVAEYFLAVEIRTRLVLDHPGVAEYKARLAEDHLNLGLAYIKTGGPAEASFRQAEDLLGPLAREHPERHVYVLSLAAVYVNWSLVLEQKNRASEALQMRERAVDLAESVLRQEPQYAWGRSRALQAHGARALSLEHLGRWADAVRDWDRVIELAEEPERRVYRLRRALALVRGGEYTRGTAEAVALEHGPRPPDDQQYNLACVWAMAIVPVRSDSRLSAEERSTRAEEYAGRSVTLLRQLHASGYFKEHNYADLLGTDPDLAPLRGRADFQQLLPAGNK